MNQPAKSGKNQPKSSLNLKQKLDILTKLDKGVQGNVLAAEYGVTKSTITYIKKQKNDILSSVSNTNKDAQQKRLRKSEFPEMEEKLYTWFRDQRERNCPINSVLLKAKAKDLFAKLYPDQKAESFQASDGWFHKFKKRFNIRFLKVCGEKLDCDQAAVRPFLNRLNAKIEEMGLTKEQIYNGDETGLFFRVLPENTYVSENEKSAAGHKKSKERVTIMLCSNATGTHKVKPLVIGKSRNPRCFKGFRNPLDYNHSQKAWMTTHIFTHWFHTCFVKQVNILSIQSLNIFRIVFSSKMFCIRCVRSAAKTIYRQKPFCSSIIAVLTDHQSNHSEAMTNKSFAIFCHQTLLPSCSRWTRVQSKSRN